VAVGAEPGDSQWFAVVFVVGVNVLCRSAFFAGLSFQTSGSECVVYFFPGSYLLRVSLFGLFLVAVVVLRDSAFPVWVVGSFEAVFGVAFLGSECSGAGSATGLSVSLF